MPEEGLSLVPPPLRKSSSNSRIPRHTHAHMCTHIRTHLLPEYPVPAAPAPSGAAQEWGPHTAVRRGPSGRRHRKGVQGHHSTWRLCRPAKCSPCKAHGQMDQAELPFITHFLRRRIHRTAPDKGSRWHTPPSFCATLTLTSRGEPTSPGSASGH